MSVQKPVIIGLTLLLRTELKTEGGETLGVYFRKATLKELFNAPPGRVIMAVILALFWDVNS